jgi:hypothetical protein
VLDYKLYCLDKRGHILHRHDFEAADDGAALKMVREVREHPDLDCELWQRARKIASLPARSLSA